MEAAILVYHTTYRLRAWHQHSTLFFPEKFADSPCIQSRLLMWMCLELTIKRWSHGSHAITLVLIFCCLLAWGATSPPSCSWYQARIVSLLQLPQQNTECHKIRVPHCLHMQEGPASFTPCTSASLKRSHLDRWLPCLGFLFWNAKGYLLSHTHYHQGATIDCHLLVCVSKNKTAQNLNKTKTKQKVKDFLIPCVLHHASILCLCFDFLCFVKKFKTLCFDN